MDKFLERFGLSDLFAMLIPGMFFLVGIFYIIPCIEKNIPAAFESEIAKIFLFFAVSYVAGMIFYEVGEVFEYVIFCKFTDRGTHKQRLFSAKQRTLSNNLDYNLAVLASTKLCEKNILDHSAGISEKEQSEFIFNYCMSSLEMKGLYGKAEKMLSIAEMSRSIYVIAGVQLLVHLLWGDRTQIGQFFITICFLLAVVIIFYFRTRRYENYRVETVIRRYAIMADCI